MKKSLLALSATALLCASASSFAVQPYLIGQIGQSNFDIDLPDDSDTYFSFGAGFDVSKNLAFELSYKDFGRASGHNVHVDFSSFSGAAVGKLPVGPSVELLGKLGIDIWNANANYNQADDNGTDLFLGFGAAFNIDRRTDITLTYELHELGDVNADVLAVGITYGF